MIKLIQALAAIVFVVTTATGAFADGRGGLEDGFHGNTAYEATLPNFPDVRGAYASKRQTVKSRSVYAPNGYYQGSDPDANVRLELLRYECRWGC